MITKLYQHFSIALQAATFAFNQSYRNGRTIEEILGFTDELTGIPNRKAFDAERNNIHVFETFILIDVDNLKLINDSFGHLFGDSILKSCAQILMQSTEKVGKSYRFGGDEFALIVPQCWVKSVRLNIANRIKEDGRFTVSMGISPPCGAEGFTEEIFNAAEIELYKAKNRLKESGPQLSNFKNIKEQLYAEGKMYDGNSRIMPPGVKLTSSAA